MRGGLGRTLLSAFLLLTIVPLAAISFLAVNWARPDLRQEVVTKLVAVAQRKETEIEVWITSLTIQLDTLADSPANRQLLLSFLSTEAPSAETGSLIEQTLNAARNAGPFEQVGLQDVNGRLLVATGTQRLARLTHLTPSLTSSRLADPVMGQSLVVWRALQDDKGDARGYLVGLIGLRALDAMMTHEIDLGETGETYLVGPEMAPLTLVRFGTDSDLSPDAFHTMGVESALSGREGPELYTGYYGEPVIGVYRWLPALQAAVIAEQTQREAFAQDDALVTLLIGASLAVALLTTLLAAVITRQLSRPIVQLTLSAVKIAGGDLEQSVPVERRDEIGILAQAFNVMTAELRSLYQSLERKVAERTRQLREANQQLRYQAMQLALSAEVGRTVTSILDLDELLQKVVELIRNSYRLLRVSIYLLDESGRHVVRQARSTWTGDPTSLIGLQAVHRDSLLGQAVADCRPHLDDLRTNLAMPLRAGQRAIGVLRLQAYQNDEISEADISVIQSLADQISVAIQNAQTYAVEKNAAERLYRLDQVRSQSLGNMSRELATSLNSIIGFSRLILKGVDGPLTEQQRTDVSAINRSGQHLLGLLDNILELIELESSDRPLEQTSIELSQIVADVIDVVAPLAEERSIVLRSKCSANLPLLRADGERLGQVLAHFVSSVVEAAEGDAVTVGARVTGGNGREVMVSVVSGSEVPWFADDADMAGLSDNGIVWDGTENGIKLMLSKRIIELHGGHLWWGNGRSQPARFVFTLPVDSTNPSRGADSHVRERGEDTR
jgi:signal transduction histidine kinase/HAMP domain-containing protein